MTIEEYDELMAKESVLLREKVIEIKETARAFMKDATDNFIKEHISVDIIDKDHLTEEKSNLYDYVNEAYGLALVGHLPVGYRRWCEYKAKYEKKRNFMFIELEGNDNDN